LRILFGIIIVLSILTSVHAETTVERKISLGGQLSGGNTDVQSLHLDFYFGRNQKSIDQTAIKGSFDREFSQGKETQFKANAKMRYSKFLSPQLFNYYKLTLEHDQFQDIALRFIPTVGMGYWFIKEVDYNSMLELAVGFEKDFLADRDDELMAIINVGSDVKFYIFSNNFDLYVNPADLDNYRLVNTANLRIKLNENYAFKLTLREEYNNRPASGVLKNDLALLTSLEFASKDIL
jgi:putative salt-induced outer membrane protein YdiY